MSDDTVVSTSGAASFNAGEGAIRHLKATLSVDAAFAAEGFHSPPGALAAMVADYVNQATRNISISKIANMAPGSGNLGTAAAAGVNVVIGSLTPDQRTVLRAGGNPLSPSDMASFGTKLGLSAYAALMKGESGVGGSHGGRYGAMKDGAPTESPGQQVATLGKLSGDAFASRLGFTGEQAKQFGQMFNGTSGAFRASAEDYKKVMDDPNSTPEQREEAAKKMEATAKTKKEKETAQRFREAVEKMKADGVDLADPKAITTYKDKDAAMQNTTTADRELSKAKVVGKSDTQLDKNVDRAVANATKADTSKEPARKPKPATIQSTL